MASWFGELSKYPCRAAPKTPQPDPRERALAHTLGLPDLVVRVTGFSTFFSILPPSSRKWERPVWAFFAWYLWVRNARLFLGVATDAQARLEWLKKAFETNRKNVVVVPEGAIVYNKDRSTAVEIPDPTNEKGKRRVAVTTGISRSVRAWYWS